VASCQTAGGQASARPCWSTNGRTVRSIAPGCRPSPKDAARIKARGQELLRRLVRAIALGRGRLGLSRKRLDLPAKQAAAATGQSLLMHAWEERSNPTA